MKRGQWGCERHRLVRYSIRLLFHYFSVPLGLTDSSSPILFCQFQVSKKFNLFSLCSPQKEVSLCEMINHIHPYSLQCVVGSSSRMSLCKISFFSALWCLKKWKEALRERREGTTSEGKSSHQGSFQNLFFPFFFKWENIYVHWSEFWFKPEFKFSLGSPVFTVEKEKRLYE